MTLGMKPHRYCSAFKGITLTTSVPRKSITFTAICLCSPGWKGNEVVPGIFRRPQGFEY
jgi:hypothetical protein